MPWHSRRSIATPAPKIKWGPLGGDHPQDLLPEPTKQFIDPLF
jgi:hypothetical protein